MQKSLGTGEPSLQLFQPHKHTQCPKENKQYSTWSIKQREAKNILGKYQTTYFMIFKCHFCSNIDFFFFLWRMNYRSCSTGRDQGFLSSTQLVKLRVEVVVISYEFLSTEAQTAERTLRGDPSGEDNTPGKGPEWATKKHKTTSQSCCYKHVAAGARLQERNTIQSLICLTRLLSPRIGFEADYFRVAQAGKKAVELEAIVLGDLKSQKWCCESERGWTGVRGRLGARNQVTRKEGVARLPRRGFEKLARGSGCELRFLEGGHGRLRGKEREN